MADGANSAAPASSSGGMEALTAWASDYASKRGFTPEQLLEYLKTAVASQEKKERKSHAVAPPWMPSTVTLPARAAKGARVWVTLIGDTRASEEHRSERVPTDVRVKAEGRVFHAHREVLVAASEYFKALFESGMSEATSGQLELNETSADELEHALCFLYYGECTLRHEGLISLLLTASKLEASDMRERAVDAVVKKLDAENVLGAWDLADVHGLTRMEDLVAEEASNLLGILAPNGPVVQEPDSPQTYRDPNSSAVLQVWKVSYDRGISFEDALAMYQDCERYPRTEGDGFYISKRKVVGASLRPEDHDLRNVLLLLADPKVRSRRGERQFQVLRPGSGFGTVMSVENCTGGERGYFKRVEPNEASDYWTRCHDRALTTCAHGPNCAIKAAGQICRLAMRHVRLAPIVTGAIVKRQWGAIRKLVRPKTAQKGKLKLPTMTRLILPPTGDMPARRLLGVQIAREGDVLQPDYPSFERFLENADWSAGANSNEWAAAGLPDSLELDVQEL